MPPKIARVLGPYRCRDKWRVVVFENEGRKSMVANSVEEAEKIKADLLASLFRRETPQASLI